ncbi:MAG: hypothetical protein FJW66_04550 [Actinobacteria bacterium]|nr:hypothetical protein [Actinomycetota bacterium]
MASKQEIQKFNPKPRKNLHKRGVYKPLYFFEESFKRCFFDCRSCGQCILSTTGFVCPMRCPKTLRNGPCGGASNGNCEVDRTKRCVWVEIYDNSSRLLRLKMLDKFQFPIDHQLVETSAVVNFADGRIEGMHLAIPGNGPALGQLIKMACRITSYRIVKFFRAPSFWQKQESHYLGA